MGMRWAHSAWLAGLLVACGSRTSLDITAGSSGRIVSGRDGGGDAASDAEEGLDGSLLSDVSLPACDAGPPVATTWFVPVAPDPASTLTDVWAVAAVDDGSLFAAGCGDPSAPNLCPDTPTRGGGPCFLIKLDASGRRIFEDRFTDGINDPLTVRLVADDQGGVTIGLEDDEGTDLGGIDQPFGCVVGRLDAAGGRRFTTPIPADCTVDFAFAADKKGRSALAAGCGSDTDCKGGQGIVVVRVDETGAVTGTRTFIETSTMSNITIAAAALREDGLLLLVGFAYGVFDFGKGPRDMGTIGALFLATYDSSFALQDFFSVVDHGAHAQAAATPKGDAFVVVGDMDRPLDFGGGPLPYQDKGDVFVAGLTPQLGYLFANGYGDISYQTTTNLCAAPDGSLAWIGIAGMEMVFGPGNIVSGAPATAADGFLATFLSDGGLERAISTETTARDVGCTPSALLVVGSVEGATDLGAGTMPPGGFIMRRPWP